MAHERALAWAQRAGSPVDEARAFGGVGDALYQRGRMRSARDHFRQCVAEARKHGAVGLALSNAPMLALTRAVCGEVREALEDCTAIAAEAVRFGDPRSELITRDIEAMISLYRADYERMRRACDRGLALARQLGARRFEAELMTLQGHAIGELGGAADAQVLLQRASALALDVARTYCGPWCLGIQALHTPNVERARELLAQGESLLAGGCVSHNHLEFRRAAMEFWLRHGNFRETRRHADALRAYTADEPLAWSGLVITRAEYLADRTEDPARADLAARRDALVRDIEAADFAWLLRRPLKGTFTFVVSADFAHLSAPANPLPHVVSCVYAEIRTRSCFQVYPTTSPSVEITNNRCSIAEVMESDTSTSCAIMPSGKASRSSLTASCRITFIWSWCRPARTACTPF